MVLYYFILLFSCMQFFSYSYIHLNMISVKISFIIFNFLYFIISFMKSHHHHRPQHFTIAALVHNSIRCHFYSFCLLFQIFRRTSLLSPIYTLDATPLCIFILSVFIFVAASWSYFRSICLQGMWQLFRRLADVMTASPAFRIQQHLSIFHYGSTGRESCMYSNEAM